MFHAWRFVRCVRFSPTIPCFYFSRLISFSYRELLPGDDVREVHNYVTALDYGLERLKTLPISLRLIREIHEKLMHGVRGGNLTSGEFRRTQNWIGPAGSTIMTATYVPPPVDEMNQALGDLENSSILALKCPSWHVQP